MFRNRLQTHPSFDAQLKLVKNADYVLLHFTDILGCLKGRTIPAEQAENAIAEGVPFDGSSMVGGTSPSTTGYTWRASTWPEKLRKQRTTG